MSSLVPEVGSVEPIEELYRQIHAVLVGARSRVRRTANHAMVQTYWQVGRLIVEGERGGAARAAYGRATLGSLSKRLGTRQI